MFTLLETTEFAGRGIRALRYRHHCGMEVISLEAADSENLFALCFGTTPVDNTGIAHIMEHSVLEGSKRYPVKDPFVCMLKTSVATFINAMTYHDRTIYPCTSCCKKDYFNLFNVYWDAVFHPRLTRETFAQEGWHYEIHGSGKKARLKYNGIVLNEMSGYYSDPGLLLGRAIETGLFGDTSMRFDSGGAPADIPKLSYAAFRRFHRRHYAPGVAKVVLYGDIPTEEKLAFIEEQLSQEKLSPVEPIEPPQPSSGAVPPQPVVRVPFTPDPGAKASGRGMCAVAWALDESRDIELDLSFQLLEAVLLGNSASPLSKALLESRIGLSPMASGYDNETRYTSFQISMRGVQLKDFDRFQTLVEDTLRQIVRDGLDQQQIAAAIANFEFNARNVSQRYAIDILEDICASWTYGDDPWKFLRLSEALPKVRELANQPGFFEGLIQRWLLDNPRVIRVELVPDENLKQRQEKQLEQRLAKRLAGWSEERIRHTKEYAALLKQRALTPDTPQALATLPQLTPNDLPKILPHAPMSTGVFANGLRWQRGEVPNNGISRVQIMADGSSLPPHLLPWMPIFNLLFLKVGSVNKSYDQWGAEIASIGAGLSFTNSCTADLSPESRQLFILSFNVEALEDKFPRALALLEEYLNQISFGERRRIVEMLSAAAASSAAGLNTRRNLLMCSARASAGIHKGGLLAEENSGVAYYQRLQKLGALKEDDLDELCTRMAEIAQWLVNIPWCAVGFVGSDQALAQVEKLCLMHKASSRPEEYKVPANLTMPLDTPQGRKECLALSTKVCSNCRVMAAPLYTSPERMPLTVLSSMLSSGYLWDEIRAKGGAYHAGFRYAPRHGVATLLSSEDPNGLATYGVFDYLAQWIAGENFTQADVSKAVLSTAGRYLRPERSAELVSKCAQQLLDERSPKDEQRDFEELLKVDAPMVREAGMRLFSAENPHNDCSAGPAQLFPSKDWDGVVHNL